jgi:hypothetical protein
MLWHRGQEPEHLPTGAGVRNELARQSRHPKDAPVQSIFLFCKPFPGFRALTPYCNGAGDVPQNKEQPGQGCSYVE